MKYKVLAAFLVTVGVLGAVAQEPTRTPEPSPPPSRTPQSSPTPEMRTTPTAPGDRTPTPLPSDTSPGVVLRMVTITPTPDAKNNR